MNKWKIGKRHSTNIMTANGRRMALHLSALPMGKWCGATLDRNGLRPSRFVVYDDGRVVMSSEAGALPTRRKKK